MLQSKGEGEGGGRRCFRVVCVEAKLKMSETRFLVFGFQCLFCFSVSCGEPHS